MFYLQCIIKLLLLYRSGQLDARLASLAARCRVCLPILKKTSPLSKNFLSPSNFKQVEVCDRRTLKCISCYMCGIVGILMFDWRKATDMQQSQAMCHERFFTIFSFFRYQNYYVGLRRWAVTTLLNADFLRISNFEWMSWLTNKIKKFAYSLTHCRLGL